MNSQIQKMNKSQDFVLWKSNTLDFGELFFFRCDRNGKQKDDTELGDNLLNSGNEATNDYHAFVAKAPPAEKPMQTKV